MTAVNVNSPLNVKRFNWNGAFVKASTYIGNVVDKQVNDFEINGSDPG